MATVGHRRGDLKGLRQCGYIDHKGDINVPHSLKTVRDCLIKTGAIIDFAGSRQFYQGNTSIRRR